MKDKTQIQKKNLLEEEDMSDLSTGPVYTAHSTGTAVQMELATRGWSS